MSLLSDVFTGGASSLIRTAADVVGEFVTTDKERLSAQIEIEAMGLKQEEAYLADTQNARHMQEVALQQEDLFSKRFIYFFSGTWSLFAMGFFIAVTFAEIPEKNIRIVDTILGFLLGTAIAAIFNFFLGTTHSSRKKDDTIQSLAGAK